MILPSFSMSMPSCGGDGDIYKIFAHFRCSEGRHCQRSRKFKKIGMVVDLNQILPFGGFLSVLSSQGAPEHHRNPSCAQMLTPPFAAAAAR